MKKSPWKIIFVCLSLIGVVAVIVAGYIIWVFNQPVTMPPDKTMTEIHITAQMNVRDAVEELSRNQLLSMPDVAGLCARLYARWTKKGVQRGVYPIKSGMKQWQAILLFFSRANVQTVSVTFLEGSTVLRFARLVAEKVGCSQSDFLRLAYSDSLRKARGIEGISVEGYLMPDTYQFYKQSTAAEILDKLLDAQQEFWDKECRLRAQEQGYSKHELLTLASIVEAETPVNAEKKKVSGVYVNRLKMGMKLEADPTIQYVLDRMNPNRENRRVLFKDLTLDSPYNTYKNFGLPPTPINSPGKEAIRAAVTPELHRFFYFVAALDGSHTHIFSRTPEEHQRAVSLFRARRARINKSGRS